MLKHFLDSLIHLDYVIWYYLNTRWHNDFFDAVIPFLRNQWFWAPLYLFLALFIPRRYGRQGLVWCTFFLITFTLSDQISASLLKPLFHRARPCNNPILMPFVHLLVSCGSGYSFPSSHASNHFAMGIFSACTLGRYARWVWPVAVLWALSVSFAQVYVGVHFPLDVTCGGILGAAIGLATGSFFNRYLGLVPQKIG